LFTSTILDTKKSSNPTINSLFVGPQGGGELRRSDQLQQCDHLLPTAEALAAGAEKFLGRADNGIFLCIEMAFKRA
jgi:hypothetical protein